MLFLNCFCGNPFILFIVSCFLYPIRLHRKILLSNKPFVDKPEHEVAVGEDFVDKSPGLREREEEVGEPTDDVDDEEVVPPLLAVVEGHHVDSVVGDVYRGGGRQYWHHALNGDHIMPFRNLDVHFIAFHYAE